jgi:acetamidase/formamidase
MYPRPCANPDYKNKTFGTNLAANWGFHYHAYRKVRDFLMRTQQLSEDEAISLISIAVDFGVTQVVDGNWGVHASIKKSLFAGTNT